MPLYFFDVIDDGTRIPDEVGTEIADLKKARAELVCALADFARDMLPDRETGSIAIELRDGDVPKFRATITVQVETLS